ncbi:MAG: hypothetical protein U9P63_02315 [Patescibacteria group bacterium]|nr:hypothetical protein [Patescibacteria group bacterium]MEA2113467.1 hypothetical protein [Patescibacteria group bacterium]
MNKNILVKIEGTELKIGYGIKSGDKETKVFKIQHRKQSLTKNRLKNNSLYLQDPYWKNGGPCPPGNYYLFYRYRIENGKNRDRLEFCQTKPDKLIINEDNGKNAEILKRQGCLKFKNSADRTNIQIHGGNKSRGCFVIKNSKTFYGIVKNFLRDGYLVKIKVDDYWKAREGKKEIGRYKI